MKWESLSSHQKVIFHLRETGRQENQEKKKDGVDGRKFAEGYNNSQKIKSKDFVFYFFQKSSLISTLPMLIQYEITESCRILEKKMINGLHEDNL